MSRIVTKKSLIKIATNIACDLIREHNGSTDLLNCEITKKQVSKPGLRIKTLKLDHPDFTVLRTVTYSNFRTSHPMSDEQEIYGDRVDFAKWAQAASLLTGLERFYDSAWDHFVTMAEAA